MIIIVRAALAVFISIALLTSCVREPADTKDRKDAAIRLVRQFFEAFDARDMTRIEASFAPSAQIIHHNGVITDIPTMLTIVRETKRWAPRKRELSDFKVKELGGGYMLVTCRNHIVADPSTPQETAYTYIETWLLQSVDGALRAIHVHYSMVTAKEHSESADP